MWAKAGTSFEYINVSGSHWGTDGKENIVHGFTPCATEARTGTYKNHPCDWLGIDLTVFTHRKWNNNLLSWFWLPCRKVFPTALLVRKVYIYRKTLCLTCFYSSWKYLVSYRKRFTCTTPCSAFWGITVCEHCTSFPLDEWHPANKFLFHFACVTATTSCFDTTNNASFFLRVQWFL